MIGSPAASADVQVSGRSAFERRSKMAPESAVHDAARERAIELVQAAVAGVDGNRMAIAGAWARPRWAH